MSTIKVDTIQTRGGVSEIAIDKLKGASSASSISVVAEGGTNTTNMQQGLAKAFLAYKGNDTAGIYDSNNIGSVTDNAAGKHTPNFTNSFNGANDYATTGFGQQDTGGGGRIVCGISSPATSNRPINTVNISNTSTDLEWLNLSFHGDLS